MPLKLGMASLQLCYSAIPPFSAFFAIPLHSSATPIGPGGRAKKGPNQSGPLRGRSVAPRSDIVLSLAQRSSSSQYGHPGADVMVRVSRPEALD